MKALWRQLVEELVGSGVLKTPSIIAAFEIIDRADFVSAESQNQAYFNEPLSIGFGQTISQPWTVAFMLEKLRPAAGQKILDIGAGSGWQTALLAQIVGSRGQVIGLELIPELCRQSLKNIARYGFIKRRTVELHCLNGVRGFPAAAPFDRIISAAAAEVIPPAWCEQLKVGGPPGLAGEAGRLVAPVDSTIIVMEKLAANKFHTQTFPGFAFVPFVATEER